jgi:hypothetical protein
LLRGEACVSRQKRESGVVYAPKIRGRDVSTTMIYTHVLKVTAGGAASPLDSLRPDRGALAPRTANFAAPNRPITTDSLWPAV